MGRDDDYIKGTTFSDCASRGELVGCAVGLGLTPGDYKDKSLLRRALSDKLTQNSADARLAAAAPS